MTHQEMIDRELTPAQQTALRLRGYQIAVGDDDLVEVQWRGAYVAYQHAEAPPSQWDFSVMYQDAVGWEPGAHEDCDADTLVKLLLERTP